MLSTSKLLRFLVLFSQALITVQAANCGEPLKLAKVKSHDKTQSHYYIPTPGATKAWNQAVNHLTNHPEHPYALLTVSYKGQPIWQLQRKISNRAGNSSYTQDAFGNIWSECFRPGPAKGGDTCPSAVYHTGVWDYEGQWFWAGWWPFNDGGGESKPCVDANLDRRDMKMVRRGWLASGGLEKETVKRGEGDEDDSMSELVVLSVEKRKLKRHELPYPQMFAGDNDEPTISDDGDQVYAAVSVEVDFQDANGAGEGGDGAPGDNTASNVGLAAKVLDDVLGGLDDAPNAPMDPSQLGEFDVNLHNAKIIKTFNGHLI